MATRSIRQIRRIAEILKLCRPLICRNYMICYALGNLQAHKQITLAEKLMVKNYLIQLMDGQQAILAWLWNKKVIPLGEYANYSPELINYRERWIDHIVTYLNQLCETINAEHRQKVQSVQN